MNEPTTKDRNQDRRAFSSDCDTTKDHHQTNNNNIRSTARSTIGSFMNPNSFGYSTANNEDEKTIQHGLLDSVSGVFSWESNNMIVRCTNPTSKMIAATTVTTTRSMEGEHHQQQQQERREEQEEQRFQPDWDWQDPQRFCETAQGDQGQQQQIAMNKSRSGTFISRNSLNSRTATNQSELNMTGSNIEDGVNVTYSGTLSRAATGSNLDEEGIHATESGTLSGIGGSADENFLEKNMVNGSEGSTAYGSSQFELLGPFAPREGKVLSWSHVNMTVTSSISQRKQKEGRKILHDVWGKVPKQEVTAIMGPSGTGKSSLLEILSGRISSGGRIRVQHDIRLDNKPINPRKTSFRKTIAFVAQDNSLQVTSTPREAIRFSAKLRLPRTTTESQLDYLTSQILTELGLNKCADTMIGGGLIKGISGGERKRTSVGVELVVQPCVVFLDEPTSGLDSFNAVQLCQVLKKVAKAGASVLFTIHQPSSIIFNSFDHLILLNKGRVMYQGPVTQVSSYFKDHGFPLPQNFNPADWIMHVAQSIPLEQLTASKFFAENPGTIQGGGDDGEFTIASKDSMVGGHCREIQVVNIRDDEDSESDFIGGVTAVDDCKAPPVGICVQICLLLQREIRDLYRAKLQLGARFALSIVISVLIGAVFWNLGSIDLGVPTHLQSLFGALLLVATQAITGTALPSLLTFPLERPVFLREFSTNHYSVVSYFTSRLVVEALVTAVQMLVATVIMYFMIDLQSDFSIVFLSSYMLGMTSTAMAVMIGCTIEDAKLGIEMMPIIFLPQFLLSGFFVTPELIPVWLRWSRYIWPMTYSLNILIEAEFNHGCGNNLANFYCNALLDATEVKRENLWLYWVLLCVLFIFYRLTALAILHKKARKFF